MLIILLSTVIPLVVAISTGIITYLVSRRTSSGRIATSEASQLWEQTRAIIDDLREAKDRAENQRDKLLELQRESTHPALEAISISQQHVLEVLSETLKTLEDINIKAERLELVVDKLEEFLDATAEGWRN